MYTSVKLSLLSFALSSWLDGSSQMRRSLILLPHTSSGISNTVPSNDSSPSSSTPDQELAPHRRFLNACKAWFERPAKDLDEEEKSLSGALDVSLSLLLLRILGSGPMLPFVFNPLNVVILFPRKLQIGTVKWSHVMLTSLILSILHEAQRTSVSMGLSWWRHRRASRNHIDIGDMLIKGSDITVRNPISESENSTDEEEEANCIICSGVGIDSPTSTTLPNVTSLPEPSLGPLEGFCVNAPQKHPMHRECFLAWKNTYWERRSQHTRPIITLLCGDGSVPRPNTWQWRTSQAILKILRIPSYAYYVTLSRAQLTDAQRDIGDGIGESVFTLHSTSQEHCRMAESEERKVAEMVTSWPPCPGCRSAVKMSFMLASLVNTSKSKIRAGSAVHLANMWVKTWRQLVTGRTVLLKTITQILFVFVLVSASKIRRPNNQPLLSLLFSR